MVEKPRKRIGTLNMGDLRGRQPSEGKIIKIEDKDLYRNGTDPFSPEEENEVLKETTFPSGAVQVHDRL